MGAFNNSKFNLNSFNTSTSAEASIVGASAFDYEIKIGQVLIEKSADKVNSYFDYETSANFYTNIEIKDKLSAELNYQSSAILTSEISIGNIPESEIVYEAKAMASLVGEEYIEIAGFTLRPGQEIIIDTCELTATIDGENAIHLLTPDGDFFDFLPGQNDIEVTAIGGDNISIDTYWKDRWL